MNGCIADETAVAAAGTGNEEDEDDDDRPMSTVSESRRTPFDRYGRRTYVRTCRKLGVVPITSVGTRRIG